ncbi:MAG TPA: hypothetical protein VFP65_11070 [Anaeromyxobacteraceae bacterium]|nr:hypothetical protein [Anaeromyxobacteraceae bacterium]
MRKVPVLLGFALAAALPMCAGAQSGPPLPGGIPDLVGARALGLDAYRGIVTGNDGIYTNAASLAARRRYAIETQWYLERFGDETPLQVLSGSIVDSEASVTGGFSFGRVLSGPWTGNLYHVPIAFAVGDSLFLGATGKYLSLEGQGEIRAATLDASAFLKTSMIALGFSGYNLVAAGHQQVMPRAIGAGASFGDGRRYNFAADWRGDFDRAGKLTNLYAFGAELLVGDYFPLRGGWMKDETRNASFWSAGAGLVTTGGFALDLSYRQGIDEPSNRVFGAAIKIYMLQ